MFCFTVAEVDLFPANVANCCLTSGSLKSLPVTRLRIGALAGIANSSKNAASIILGSTGVSTGVAANASCPGRMGGVPKSASLPISAKESCPLGRGFGATRSSSSTCRGSLNVCISGMSGRSKPSPSGVIPAGGFARIAPDARRRLSISASVALVSAMPSLVRASSYSFRNASGLRTSPALATVSCSSLVRLAVVCAMRSVSSFPCAVSTAEAARSCSCSVTRSAKSWSTRPSRS